MARGSRLATTKQSKVIISKVSDVAPLCPCRAPLTDQPTLDALKYVYRIFLIWPRGHYSVNIKGKNYKQNTKTVILKGKCGGKKLNNTLVRGNGFVWEGGKWVVEGWLTQQEQRQKRKFKTHDFVVWVGTSYLSAASRAEACVSLCPTCQSVSNNKDNAWLRFLYSSSKPPRGRGAWAPEYLNK